MFTCIYRNEKNNIYQNSCKFKNRTGYLKTLSEQIFKIASRETIAGFIIQPTYGVSEPSLEKLLEFYDLVYPYYRDVRVIPQLQKIIDVP